MDAISSTVPRSLMNALLMKGRDQRGRQNLEIKLYNPVSLNLIDGTHRDHSKMILVDGQTVLSGGRNLGDKYFGKNPDRNFTDLYVLIKGPVSKEVQQNFYAVWNSKVVHFLSHQPDELVTTKNNHMTNECLITMLQAEREIEIIFPYLIPTEELNSVFESLIQRGVKIKVITNSLRSTDNLFAQAGYRSSKKK